MKKQIGAFLQRNANIACFFLGIFAVLAYALPFIIQGDDSWIRIHDCLDDKIAHLRMVIGSGALFDHNKTLPILYGISRSEYIFEYTITTFIFALFPSYWAFVINDTLVRIIAFCGMYMLLSQYVIDKDKYQQKFLSSIISICFSYISFYTIYGLSAAGIPLLFFAFLNLSNSVHKKISYALIILFALYSGLILSGCFVGFVLLLGWIFLVIKRRNFCVDYFIGLCVLGVTYLIVNIDIVITFLFSDNFISHRVEFRAITIKEAVIAIVHLFYRTQYHGGEFPTILIIFSVILVILPNIKMSKQLRYSMIILLLTIVLSIIGILLKATNVSFFRLFQMDRFYFLLPSLWVITFACALRDLTNKYSIYVSLVFILVFSMQIFNHNSELKEQVKTICGKQREEPSYKHFYDTQLFDKIANDICEDKSTCNVVSIGIHPAVAEYNGFRILDGYVANYRLDYKHKFREIIKAELDKDETIKSYFDEWGNRCYIFFAGEKSEAIGKKENMHININLNTNKLKELGCNYILSAVYLDNYSELGLQYVQKYSTKDSYWEIKVYRL